MNKKKKICWVTPDCFVDVDLPIIKEISKDFEIHWFLFLSISASADDEEFVKEQIKEHKEINLHIIRRFCRIRSPKHIVQTISVLRQVKAYNPDIYYLSDSFQPYGIALYKFMLPIKKCVVACHNVTTPNGATNERMAKIYTHLWLSTFKNIQTFSISQYNKLIEKYTGKNVLMAHLALKDYGEPSIHIDKMVCEKIRFLVFGNIVRYKRIDLLLKAVEELKNRGIENFIVRIAGNCRVWKTDYEPLIKHPELYELNISRIPNEDVANLFAESHYFVMPYQDIAQSGAITVAFRYNVPTLVSDIEPFKEFVEDGETGFTFQSGNVKSLADKVQWIIENHQTIYKTVCENQKEFVEKNLSLKSIAVKYIEYFNKL